MNRLSRKHIRPLFLQASSEYSSDASPGPLKPLYDAAGMLCTALMINYLAVSFVVLSWEESLFGFQAMHFAGHVGLIVAYIVLSLIPSGSKRAPKQL